MKMITISFDWQNYFTSRIETKTWGKYENYYKQLNKGGNKK